MFNFIWQQALECTDFKCLKIGSKNLFCFEKFDSWKHLEIDQIFEQKVISNVWQFQIFVHNSQPILSKMSGPKNTLFNYFKKVSSPSTSVSSPTATPKSTPSTPVSQNKKRDEPEKKTPAPSTPVSRNVKSEKKEKKTPAPSTPVSRNSKSAKKESEKMDCAGDSQGRKRKRIRYGSGSPLLRITLGQHNITITDWLHYPTVFVHRFMYSGSAYIWLL